jgi:WD40 repeat protein
MEKSKEITLLGRDIFLLNNKGELTGLSFERNEKFKLKNTNSPALVCSSFSTDKVITGHQEGSIRIWDFSEKSAGLLKGHHQEVITLAADYFGCIYSAGADRSLKQWDLERGVVKTVRDLDGKIKYLRLYPNGKILALTETETKDTEERETKNYMIRILDFKNRKTRLIPLPFTNAITGVEVYFDGRIIISLAPSGDKKNSETLAIISTGESIWEYKILKAQYIKTNDCLTMGPKIITCCQEATGEHTIRLWGTEHFVKAEIGKLSLQHS